MNFRLTARAERDYDALPLPYRRALINNSRFFYRTSGTPSLKAKKYDERNDLWQGRVNQAYRFYFQIKGDTYEIVAITPHPK